MKVIAIDLDGTAINNYEFFNVSCREFLLANGYNQFKGIAIKDLTYDETWDAVNHYGLLKAYDDWSTDGHIDQPFMPGLVEFIARVEDHRDCIDIVTARTAFLEETEEHTRQLPHIRNIYAGKKDKLETLLEIDADWLIDDYRKHIDKAYNAGLNTIHMELKGYETGKPQATTATCADFFEVARVIYPKDFENGEEKCITCTA